MPELADEIATRSGIDVNYDGPELLFLGRTMMARILLNLACNAASAGAGRSTSKYGGPAGLGLSTLPMTGRGSHGHIGPVCALPSAAGAAAAPGSGSPARAALP